jgi:hypothetical protein
MSSDDDCGEHLLFTHFMQRPQESPGQQSPTTHEPPQFRRPDWQAPLQGWLSATQLLPHL